MDKIKVIALKSFEYNKEIKTIRSEPFEVSKSDFTFFESLKMVKKYEEKTAKKGK